MPDSDSSTQVEYGDDTLLPVPRAISFLHPVGQSTISQGLTIPKAAQIGWLSEIQKGQSVPVMIRFATDGLVPASLRKLNNARGQLQFRYESKQQSALREYLASLFSGDATSANAVLRVTEVESRVFLFDVLSDGKQRSAVLSLCSPCFHNCTREDVEALSEFKDICNSLAKIAYEENRNQAEYNKQIASALKSMGWSTETKILKEIGLRSDFRKNDFWLEVEFGNARVYYQDYLKFLMAMRYRQAKIGMLLCPTSAFAQLLCDLGKRRAIARRDTTSGHRPSYSGMMNLEKALRELPYLQFMLTGSIVIAGIEIVCG